MNENLLDLYSQKIIALAMDIPLTTPIEGSRAKRRSPVCGSEIAVTLRLENGVIIDFSQEVKACALGQASAAIFGQRVIGRSRTEIENLRTELLGFLKEGDNPPSPPFDEYVVLTAARDYPARHQSILLVVEATLAAIDAN